MTDVQLSVLIPTHNYANYIEEALRSVSAQQQPGVEIVVADDGSTDGTQELLRPWVERGSIRYLSQDNAGPAAARNLALREARAPIVMFLDADDSLYPGCIATTLEFYARHADADMLFTNYDIFDESGIVRASGVDHWKVFREIPHRVEPDGEWIFSEPLSYWIIRYGAFMHTSGLSLRRELVEAVGPFRPGYCYGEDDEFYARAAYRGVCGFLDRVLARKRNHPRSIIHDDKNRLRNARHLLELTEYQLQDYAEDPRLRPLLHQKVHDCAEAYARRLVHGAQGREARRLLGEYIRRYPGSKLLYKLWLRSWVHRRPTPVPS